MRKAIIIVCFGLTCFFTGITVANVVHTRRLQELTLQLQLEAADRELEQIRKESEYIESLRRKLKGTEK